MIIKSTDKKEIDNKYSNAGLKAEKQMSHYLERAFTKAEDIFVLNDIRLTTKGNTAQIDHLVIHPYGFVIIESKSVSSKIKVNSHGEWIRIFNSQESGMPSPIQQAKRQADFLLNYLNSKGVHLFRDNLINKLI